jgi:hypothetical protein
MGRLYSVVYTAALSLTPMEARTPSAVELVKLVLTGFVGTQERKIDR